MRAGRHMPVGFVAKQSFCSEDPYFRFHSVFVENPEEEILLKMF